MRTITLGNGHAPDEKTQYDVVLHLDHARTPLSLGERWGLQSTGAGFTLQEAADMKWDAHLRACGCVWLIILASEERFRDHPFTPDEILARRPEPPAPTVPEHAPPHDPALAPGLLTKARTAIRTADYDVIESLRDQMGTAAARELVRDWHQDQPWRSKDALVALLMDQLDDSVMPVMRDALRSPTLESRAYAVCVLSRDFARFDAMLDKNGALDAAKVAGAVRSITAAHPPAQ